MARAWPLLQKLNKKNGVVFTRAVQNIVQKRMAIPKDAKHDFYSIAAVEGDVNPDAEGLRRSELWAEAVFFLPAGKSHSSFLAMFLCRIRRLEILEYTLCGTITPRAKHVHISIARSQGPFPHSLFVETYF